MADPALEARVRACLQRDDDYKAPGKPRCDWDDVEAREKVIDELARDAEAVLSCLEGQTLEAEVEQAAQLIAAVVGQDLERGAEGRFCIARRVAADRIISVVDPEARHGHKTAARGFDGYKGHVSVDPDSEFIVATQVTAGNVADGNAAVDLLAEVLEPTNRVESSEPIEIYGDSAYGTAELIEHIEGAGAEANVKVQGPSGRQGMFSKDDFEIDPQAGMVRCPAGALVQIRVGKDGGGVAFFGAHCPTCPLRSQCTEAKGGRTIQIHPHERTLQRMRDTQKDPKWKERYRSTRPKVERKQAHLMFRRHGGRRSRVRGTERIGQDFALLGAGINLKRLAVLGLHWNGTRWSVA